MTVLAYIAGVLVIVVGVALSIALHEIGHLAPAKRFGVKATQYMVGFGPTVWSRTKGETEYGVKAIPLGGYVRMVGMFPPGKDGHVRADTTGRWSLMVEQAREQAAVETKDVPADRLFYTKPVHQRLIIMLGGPFMNLVIAAVLLTIITVFYGTAQSTTTLDTVSKCVIPANSQATTCAAGATPAPAAAAGLLSGDKVVAFAGQPITSWSQIQTAIRSNHGQATSITVDRNGQRITREITPVVDQRPVIGADGQAVRDADGKLKTEAVGFLGISPQSEMVPQSITTVPGRLWDGVAQTAGVVLKIPQKMVGVAQAAFGSGERDANGPISVVGVSRFAGEAASAQGTAEQPIHFADRMFFLLGLVMSLNLALFVFNLIPLLPLDGGHVAGALWEGLRRRIAKLRSAPDPGPVDVARGLPIAYGVASVLIAMSVLLIYADIVRPIQLPG